MSREGLGEAALMRQAWAHGIEQVYRGKSSKDIVEEFTTVVDILGRREFELRNFEQVVSALDAEIQPYIDEMEAIKDEQKQGEYIASVPEHIRHAIDLLGATELVVLQLKDTVEALTNLQMELEEAYEQIEKKEQKTIKRAYIEHAVGEA